METVQEFETKRDLIRYLKSDIGLSFLFYEHQLSIKHYSFDKRINWDTHIVTINGFGVVGFTNGGLS